MGQELYAKRTVALGHYRHLDALNKIRGIGSIETAVAEGAIKDGVMRAVIRKKIPYVLAGSIRDDGPMPEVIADVYRAQDRMRNLTRKATTIVCLATQLHSIATGNMTPSYTVAGGVVTAGLLLYRGHVRVCGQQAGRPGFADGPFDSDQRPRFRGDRRTGPQQALRLKPVT